jgi:hypothetical protein
MAHVPVTDFGSSETCSKPRGYQASMMQHCRVIHKSSLRGT